MEVMCENCGLIRNTTLEKDCNCPDCEDNSKPTQEELQAILEELFNRATEHNEQLQKQLAHVRSRVVQLVHENQMHIETIDDLYYRKM
jgi:queuine/archaeosine tRNA-ribosyltransferase